ncbi:MAG: flavodoxin domain-containing protein [Caldilineaceae bacterium]
MTNILIVYGSGEGQTAKVAWEIAETLTKHDAQVDLFQGTDVPPGLDLSGYDGVIIGASIHLGKYQPYMLDYARRQAQALSEMPAAFFSVCLTAAGDSPEERAQVAEYLATWAQETGWEPALVGSFAGALRYTQYGFIKRFIMRGIAKKSTGDVDTSRDYEYTDWESVAEFATNFLMLVQARQEVTA